MIFSKRLIPFLAVAATLCSNAAAQRVYLDAPEPSWTAVGGEAKVGNGLFFAPAGETLVGSFLDGSIRFYNSDTGDVLDSFTPEFTGTAMRNYGGVTFAYEGGQPYIVYAVTDNPFGEATTRVIAVNPSGEQIFETTGVPGIQAGTPVTSYDGRYVLINSNVENTGYFSVFDVATFTSGASLEPIYQATADEFPVLINVTDPDALSNITSANVTNLPFAPLGVALQPAEGYYDGGENNTNDLFVWATDTQVGASQGGIGQMYAFQLPMDPTAPLAAFPLGDPQVWESSTAPVFANEGRSMYFATTRAETRCWIGSADSDRYRFNRAKTATIGASRGSPAYVASLASPSLSGSDDMPTVYGPGAAAEIWTADYNFTIPSVVPTTGIISSRVQVSTDGEVIYYGTQAGTLVQADAVTLTPLWTLNFTSPIEGEIALNRAATMVYVVDSVGQISAYTVAIGDSNTSAPTAPTLSPTTSMMPSISTPQPTTAPAVGGVPTTAATSDASAWKATSIAIFPLLAAVIGIMV